MKPATYNFSMRRGDTFQFRARMKDSTGSYVDLTGKTFEGAVRKTTAATSSVEATFTYVVENQGTTPGGVLFTLFAPKTMDVNEVNSPIFKPTKYVYDIRIINSPSDKSTKIAGNIDLYPEVTP